MPYGAQIRPESLGRLVQQIGEQLRHIAPPDLLNAGAIELRETFEVWALGSTLWGMALIPSVRSGSWPRQLTAGIISFRSLAERLRLPGHPPRH